MKATIFLACVGLAWSQSQPQQKDPAGAQAGSSGKTTQMGSQGSSETPLRKCDSPEPAKPEAAKTTKKKKAKKQGPAKQNGPGSE